MDQRIVGFRQDEFGDWIADLECGHAQHVRHEPPWQVREWVTTTLGRESRLGTRLACRRCAEPTPTPPGAPPPDRRARHAAPESSWPVPQSPRGGRPRRRA